MGKGSEEGGRKKKEKGMEGGGRIKKGEGEGG